MNRVCLLFLCAFVGPMLAQDAVRLGLDALVAHYDRYNATHVIVSGEVISGPEMTVMILPGPPKESGRANLMLITLSEAIARKPGAMEKRFTQLLRKTHKADVEVEGRFEAADDRKWGHQLCCQFRLEISRVVSIKQP